MKNLRYDNRNACCVPYDSPPLGLAAQLQRLVVEERPGPAWAADMSTTAVSEAARKISHIVAVIRPGGDADDIR